MCNSVKLILCFLALVKFSDQNHLANRMILTGVDCSENDSNILCSNTICKTQHVKDANPKITIGCETSNEIKDVSFIYEVFTKSPTKEYRSMSIANEVDFCKIMKSMTPEQLKKDILYNTAEKYIANADDILHDCPFSKGWIMAKDFQTTDFYAPEILMAGEYRVDFRFFNTATNQTYFSPRLYFTVTPNKLAEMSEK